MKGNRFEIAIVLVGLALLSAAHGAPCSPAQAPQGLIKPLEHEVGVALKLIHVYVTGKKGKPVLDLSKEDFELIDNGTQVTVTEFEKHTLGMKPDELISGEAAWPAPETPAVKEAVRRFILLFDLAFNDARGIAKAKEAAARFIETQAQPDDEIGAVSYSTFGGIKVHEFLTKDHAKVREVLDKIDQGGITGRADEIEAMYWRYISGYIPSPEGSGLKTPIYIVEALADREQLKSLTHAFADGLITLAKALRILPGQKHIILFSRGVPSTLLYGNEAGNRDYNLETHPNQARLARFEVGDTKLKELSETMFREFASSGCTFYAFGTHASAKGTDLFGLDGRGGHPTSEGALYGESTNIFRDEKVTGGNFLRRFADTTGGRYFTNINAFERNLDQVQTLTGAYYVLGYTINEQWDGRFHDIKVKVKRKGCEVRAQAGYFNPKPYSEYTKLEKQLHLYDLALNERAFSRLPVNIRVIPLVYGGGAEQRLGVVAAIPGEVTAKLSGRRTEWVVIIFDEKGEVSNVVRTEADPAPYRGQAMIFSAGVQLDPGAYFCRLVARDMDTGLSAVGSAVATIGRARTTGLQLSTPLILAEGAAAAQVDAGPARKSGAYPLIETYAYDRARLSPIIGELPPVMSSVKAMVPYWVPGEAEPDLTFLAYVIDAKSAARTPLTISGVERIRGGPQGLLMFEIPVGGLPPGTYYLHFHSQDRTSNTAGHTSTTILIPNH